MPVGSVQVTEGSGKYLHTWQRTVSAVNREEQYVQFGESGLPTFVVPSGWVSTSTSDSHALQIMAGSSMYVRIKRITWCQGNVAGSAAGISLRLIRLTTAGSGGTLITPAPFDTADTATATAMTLPSSKGTETTTLFYWNLPLTVAPVHDPVVLWEELPRCKPLIIPAGTTNGICLRFGTGVATATVAINVEFCETAWL